MFKATLIGTSFKCAHLFLKNIKIFFIFAIWNVYIIITHFSYAFLYKKKYLGCSKAFIKYIEHYGYKNPFGGGVNFWSAIHCRLTKEWAFWCIMHTLKRAFFYSMAYHRIIMNSCNKFSLFFFKVCIAWIKLQIKSLKDVLFTQDCGTNDIFKSFM